MIRTQYLLTTALGRDETLLVNTLTGALERLPTRFLPLLQTADRTLVEAELSDEQRNVVRRLASLGFFFPEAAAENALFERLREKVAAYRQGKSSEHTIAVTHGCVFRCTYCFERGSRAHETTLGPKDVPALLDAMTAVETWVGSRVPPAVALYGGEPLQPRTRVVVDVLLEALSSRQIHFAVITNGYFLDGFIDLLARHAALLAGVQVVLDGPPAVHDSRRVLVSGAGTFGRIAANVTRALDAGLPVRVRVNVDRANLAALPALAKVFEQKGWTASPRFATLVAPVEDHLCQGLPDVLTEDELLQQYLRLESAHSGELAIYDTARVFASLWYVESRVRQSPEVVLPRFAYCDAGTGKSMCFGADGGIYPCHKALEDEEVRVGRFLPRLELHEERLARFLGHTVVDRSRCRGCSAAAFCGGGCAYAAIRRGPNWAVDAGCPPIARSLQRYAAGRVEEIREHVGICGPLRSGESHEV